MPKEESLTGTPDTTYLDMVAMEMVALGLLVQVGNRQGQVAVFVDGNLQGVVPHRKEAKTLLVDKKVSVGHVACHTVDADTHANLAAGRAMPSQPIDITALVAGAKKDPPSTTDLVIGATLRAGAQRRINAVLGENIEEEMRN